MKHTINLGSFIFSFICVGLFILYTKLFSPEVIDTVMNSIHIHSLFFLLVLTLVTCISGYIGVTQINNWQSMIRSIITIILTTLLLVFLAFILCLRSLANT